MAASSSMIRIRCPVSRCGGGGAAETASVASDMRRFPQHGKFKIKGGPGAHMAFHVNFSGVLLDDAVGDGEPQTGATPFSLFWCGLGRKEWVVNALQMFWRNPGACIRDRDAYVAIDFSRNAQGSASAHRVLRIKKEIQKDLLQFSCIPEDGWQVGHQRRI